MTKIKEHQITDKVENKHKPEGRTFTRKLQFHAFWTPEELKKGKEAKLKIKNKMDKDCIYNIIIPGF